MNNFIINLTLAILILTTNSSYLKAQTYEEKSYFPLTIPFIETYELDTSFIPTWKTRAIPASRGYGINYFNYKLLITITVMGKENWNLPFALVFELPDSKRGFIVVNQERYELLPDKFNQFLVEVHSKKKGWATFELAALNDITEEVLIPIESFPLRRRDFLLE